MLRTVRATRYVTPLREGGSLPAIMEADDDGLYVVKFRGAGQGASALIAELLAYEIAKEIELPVPETVFVELPALGKNEPDYEIRQLLAVSEGLNIGLDYLPGSFPYDPAVLSKMDTELANRIVWFDAFIMNVDRTARNTNMLMWHKNLWLIDHGASLYFHHNWPTAQNAYKSPFSQIKDHVLLPLTSEPITTPTQYKKKLTREFFERMVLTIPELWFGDTKTDRRSDYVNFFVQRMEAATIFEEEITNARRHSI